MKRIEQLFGDRAGLAVADGALVDGNDGNQFGGRVEAHTPINTLFPAVAKSGCSSPGLKIASRGMCHPSFISVKTSRDD